MSRTSMLTATSRRTTRVLFGRVNMKRNKRDRLTQLSKTFYPATARVQRKLSRTVTSKSCVLISGVSRLKTRMAQVKDSTLTRNASNRPSLSTDRQSCTRRQ